MIIYFKGHFVLVTSGDLYSNGQKTEVLDMKNSKFTCPGLPDFPVEMAKGAGGMIRNVPLICGGQKGRLWAISGLAFYDDCYVLKHKQWIKSGNLHQPTSEMGMGSVVLNGELLVNGGYLYHEGYFASDDDYPYATNEKIGLNSKSKLRDLPHSRYKHCNVPINDTHVMIIGGQNSRYTYVSDTLIFDTIRNEFSEGPPLKQARSHHGCIRAKVDDRQFLFVTGGDYEYWYGYTVLDTTEYLDLSHPENGWTYGKK